MKHFLAIPLLILSFTSFAEETDSTDKKAPQHKFQIGISGSPDICYRTLSNTEGGDIADWIIDGRNGREKQRIGYTIGVSAGYRINSLLGLETGVSFSSQGYQADIMVTTLNAPQGMEARLVNDAQYIEIPLKANFFFGKKKLGFMCSAGIITGFFLDETRTIKYKNSAEADQSVHSENDYNTVSLSPVISAGVNYRVNDRLNFRVQPTFRYGLIKTHNAPIAEHFYSAGLNIGGYISL